MATKIVIKMEDWFSNSVLYERYKLILLWSLLVQSSLILFWTILKVFLSSSLMALPWNIGTSISSSYLLSSQLLLAFILISMMCLHFHNLSMVPQICMTHYETIFLWISIERLTQIAAFTVASVIYGMSLGWNSHLDFTKSWCVNDQQLFSLFFCACSGAYICINYFVKHDYCPKFGTVRQLKLPLAKTKFREAIVFTFWEVNKHLSVFFIFFVLCNFTVKLLLSTINEGIVCDKEISPVATFFSISDIRLLSTNYSITFLFRISWSFALSLSQMFLTEEYEFSFDSVNEKPVDTLTKAIKMDHCPLLQYLAYQNFKNIATQLPSRRIHLFAISLPGGHPHNWNSLTEDSLKILNQLLATLNPKESLNKVPYLENQSVLVHSFTEQQPQTPLIINNNNYSSPQETPGLRNIAGYNSPQEAPGLRNIAGHYKIQSPFSTAQTNAIPCLNVKDSVKATAQIIQKSKTLFVAILPETFTKMFTQEITERKQELLYLSCQPSIWAIEALTSAVVASYTEDQYGVVQWSLPSIICIFLDLQGALERPQHKLASRKGCKDKNYVARQFQQSLKAVVKAALYRIVCTFWQHLNVKDYSEEQWQRLQRFRKFCE